MVEAVSAVAPQVVPSPSNVVVDSVTDSPAPLAQPTTGEIDRFGDATRSPVIEQSSQPIPRSRDGWSRAVDGVSDSLNRLATLEARVMDTSRLFQPPPSTQPRLSSSVKDGLFSGVSGGVTSSAYSDATAILDSTMQSVMAKAKEMMAFHITTSIVTQTSGELRDSLKKLSEGNA